jgi:hypothetical protein
MMALYFRQSANAIGEAQGFGKIAETKNAFQSRDGFLVNQLPIGNLKLQFLKFLRSYPRRIWPTCGASLALESTHVLVPFEAMMIISRGCRSSGKFLGQRTA